MEALAGIPSNITKCSDEIIEKLQVVIIKLNTVNLFLSDSDNSDLFENKTDLSLIEKLTITHRLVSVSIERAKHVCNSLGIPFEDSGEYDFDNTIKSRVTEIDYLIRDFDGLLWDIHCALAYSSTDEEVATSSSTKADIPLIARFAEISRNVSSCRDTLDMIEDTCGLPGPPKDVDPKMVQRG